MHVDICSIKIIYLASDKNYLFSFPTIQQRLIIASGQITTNRSPSMPELDLLDSMEEINIVFHL